MINSKELMSVTGLTRGKLRWYDQIGLLQPDEKKEGCLGEDGKNTITSWLYDENKVTDAMLIQIFSDAGYKAHDIKEIFDDKDVGKIDHIKNMIAELEERKKSIDQVIERLNFIIDSTMIPAEISIKYYEFLDNVRELRSDISLLGMFNYDEIKEHINNSLYIMFHWIVVIALLFEWDINDDCVMNAARCLYQVACRVYFQVNDNLNYKDEDIYSLDFAKKVIKGFIRPMYRDEELVNFFNECSFSGSFDYVDQVLEKFLEKIN